MKVDDLPADVLDEIRSLRQRGKGPGSIFKVLELDRYGLTFDQVKNSIYQGRFADLTPEVTSANLGRIAKLLEDSGIDPEDVAKVSAVKLSEWQGLTKNEDGEAEVHNLNGASIVLTPHWADGPKWQPVDRGPAIKLPAHKPSVKNKHSAYRRCFVWPDTQTGYRRDPVSMELEPFHDEQAIACALALVRRVRPDRLIIVGDLVDFAEFGTYEQEPGFALTVQPAIDRATRLIGEIRAAAGAECEILFIEGNHDRRLQRSITRNALAAFGIKRGMAPPEEWPVLSVPYLLRLDEFGVEYVGGYPAGLVWVNENVAVIHGARVNSAGSTALRVVDDTRVSILFGHTHRIELIHRTRQSFAGPKRSFAASMGCLCRIDGAVPGVHSSTDVFGRSVPTVENWQQGCAILHYEEGDGRFHLDLVDIQDGTAVLWGEEIAA